MDKMTPPLAAKFQELDHEEPLEVVVELGGEAVDALDRAENVEQARNAFAGITAPVKQRILSLGGNLTGEAWLNGTLQAKLTKRAIESLSDEPSIARVDLPRVLERE